MAGLPNTHDALLRNAPLVNGRTAVLGIRDPALLAQLAGPGIAMTDHAGLYARLPANDIWHPHFGYQTEGLMPGDADTVVVFLPKSRAELPMRLAFARYLGSETASIIVIGEKKEGIAGAAKTLASTLQDAVKVDSARHCQVWVARNHQALSSFDLNDWVSWQSADAAGEHLSVARMPGIFSDGALDDGTRHLLESLQEKPINGQRVLDFACGAGVIGAWLHEHHRETRPSMVIDSVDVQFQAVTCARRTYERHGVEGKIHANDGLSGLEGRWQAVVTNPPFHSGVRTDTSMTEQFLRQVASHLVAGGELRLVANSFLPYEPLMQRCVGPTERLFQDRRFTVYRAVRR
ncbi:MAG TPA: class I SAM-dependent methyltransferase [Marinobacter sp.]|nr:class I SAM-dependent methyltransferase [Marinobacter sp.]